METLYALSHIGYTIPPQADCGWIGEIGPGPDPAERVEVAQAHVSDDRRGGDGDQCEPCECPEWTSDVDRRVQDGQRDDIADRGEDEQRAVARRTLPELGRNQGEMDRGGRKSENNHRERGGTERRGIDVSRWRGKRSWLLVSVVG